MRAVCNDFVGDPADAFLMFLFRFLRVFELCAVFFIECCMDIPFVALNVFDLYAPAQRVFDLLAMRTDIFLVLFKSIEKV